MYTFFYFLHKTIVIIYLFFINKYICKPFLDCTKHSLKLHFTTTHPPTHHPSSARRSTSNFLTPVWNPIQFLIFLLIFEMLNVLNFWKKTNYIINKILWYFSKSFLNVWAKSSLSAQTMKLILTSLV
jgi:hypothetical protein